MGMGDGRKRQIREGVMEGRGGGEGREGGEGRGGKREREGGRGLLALSRVPKMFWWFKRRWCPSRGCVGADQHRHAVRWNIW